MIPYVLCLDLDPRLRDLETAAASCPPGDWRAFEAVVKAPLRRLVGLLADDDAPASLRTSGAYESVYAALVGRWEAHDVP